HGSLLAHSSKRREHPCPLHSRPRWKGSPGTRRPWARAIQGASIHTPHRTLLHGPAEKIRAFRPLSHDSTLNEYVCQICGSPKRQVHRLRSARASIARGVLICICAPDAFAEALSALARDLPNSLAL